MSVLGPLLGAAGGLIGSIFDKKSGDKDREAQERMAAQNIALQKEFAQTGIRWKVEDAKQAGIHPLYALGANTVSFSPVSVGSSPPTDFATAGQNIGSAVGAMLTPKEKADGFQKTVQDLTVRKMGLENDLLASQIRMINQPGRGPGMPGERAIAGQGDTPAVMSSAGIPVYVDPDNTPAQQAEDQYGELGGELFGAGNLLTDIFKTMFAGTRGDYFRRELPKILPHNYVLRRSPKGDRVSRRPLNY